MNHNDATDKDLPVDPDATEIVSVDLEQLLHKELDEARKAQTIAQMKAARPIHRPSQRVSTAKIPASRIPPMPIHTLPPPAPDEDDDATCIFDRAASANKLSLPRVSTPSMKSVAFPAPNFTAPRKPQPFATIPSMPAAKRAADASQGITPIQPVLPPTSRREVVMPKPNESVPPVSFPSSFPSYPPPPAQTRGATLAAVLTMAFALASMVVIGVAVLRPALLERGKIAIASAVKQKHRPAAVAPPAGVAAARPPATIAVPPILIDDEPDVTIGDQQTYAIFPAGARGHRVFMDGRAIGDGDLPALVDCGKHKLQLGSTGKERLVDLPCGGGYRLSE